MKYLLVALLMLSNMVMALESDDCVQIENEQERLKCFDKRFPRSHPSTQLIETEVILVPESRHSETQETPATDPIVTTIPPAVLSQEDSSTTDADRGWLGKMFGDRDTLIISATIKAIRIRDKQKMVFLLDNDQMWLQDSPRPLQIRKGDLVTIKSGTVGGYILRTSSGTATRVRRIK